MTKRQRARRGASGWKFLACGLVWMLLVPVAGAQQDANPHGRLPAGLDCAACHTAAGWTPTRRPMQFNHTAQTGFPLLGAHAQTQCQNCHLDLRFDEPRLRPNACAGCHVDVHQGRLSSDCASCHRPTTFADVEALQLHARTNFPLTGSHVQLTCESCHTSDRGGAFAPLDAACVACHAPDYARARTPNHAASGFPTECSQCHTTLAWQGAVFEHATVSNGFALVGAHAALTCQSCHRLPGFEPLFHPAGQTTATPATHPITKPTTTTPPSSPPARRATRRTRGVGPRSITRRSRAASRS